jgi:hypothetical protein
MRTAAYSSLVLVVSGSVLLTSNACLARAGARAFGPVRASTSQYLIIIVVFTLIRYGFINLFKETTPPWSINAHNGAGRFLCFSLSCEPSRRDIRKKVDIRTLSRVSPIPNTPASDRTNQCSIAKGGFVWCQ